MASAADSSTIDKELTSLCSSLSVENASATIDTMIKLFLNIRDHPDDERYKRVRLSNKRFNDTVRSHPAAIQFLLQSGWIEQGECMIYTANNANNGALDRLQRIQTSIQPPAAPGTSSNSFVDHEERMAQMKLLREHQKRVAEEKKMISAKIEADRLESKGSISGQPSKAKVRNFGGNVNRFEDIGVDLNKGG